MKILVVDDQAANRGLLSYLLEEDGHEVFEASDGHKGIVQFDSPDCDNINRFLSPMGGFSGDIVIAHRTNRGSMFIMLGDFTGHGLPAALGALPVNQAFQSLAGRGVSLGDLATHLNQTLYDYLPADMFCAANLIELSADGMKASCWSGGLPDMFLVDEQGLIKEIFKSDHTPLGVMSDAHFKRDVRELELKPGERLIIYSDGVTDCRDVNGEMLGDSRFAQMFDGVTKGNELFASLVARIQAFGKGRPQDDDISLLEVISGSGLS